eukprot:CAMPEP_0168440602 /NCGR_PEP_ID=MMETSP0228-20121227/43058_1 /TAXON_ID=133427 /ORGANISM="Protoceratium reticulatum, Strain CCCM 535 (=CCMP 1889)" /LENGTH=329 /DNA_ID=CAMNT_0008454899 /DNA_START=85 /DNA_END=1072 /DNA_ORIENTATION=+
MAGPWPAARTHRADAGLKDWAALLQVDKGNALELRGPPQVMAKSARFTARSTHSFDITQDLSYTYEKAGNGNGRCLTGAPGTAACAASATPRAPDENGCRASCDGEETYGCTGYYFSIEDGDPRCEIFFALITGVASGGSAGDTCMRRPNWKPTCQESVNWPPQDTTTTLTTTVGRNRATSYGDPHVTTLRGEHFDVQQPGTHTYLMVPRGASLRTAMLAVQARVEPYGSVCGNGIFLTALRLSGGWLREVGALDFATMTREYDSDETIGIRINGSRVDWHTLAAKMPPGVARVRRFHPLPHKRLTEHVDTLRVTLKLGPANLTVGWSH